MKIVKLKTSPEKFGSKRVGESGKRKNQLDLFSESRVLQLHALTSFEEALKMDEAGNITKAAKLYQKAIEEEIHVADAYCNLGILKCQEGLIAEAVNCFTLCLKHDPRHSEAHFNLANLYAEEGNLKLGKLHYEISIEIDPAFSNSYFNLGLTLAANHEYEAAIEALQKYRKITSPEEHQPAVELILSLQTMLNNAEKCG